MSPQSLNSIQDHPPVLRFHSGWRLLLRRGVFLLRSAKYLVHRRRYPRFILNPFQGGLLRTLKIAWVDLKVRRAAELDGVHFVGLTMPHFPSKAYDRMAARGGLNIAAAGTPRKHGVDTVILAITRRCDLHCQHCYERFNTAPDDTIPIERWIDVMRQIQRIGASIIVLSGGEPMARFDDALKFLQAGDKDLSDFHLHTSGYGVTMERALRLREAGLMAAAVGLDDVDPERHDRLRGLPGAHKMAVDALRILHGAGIFTYTNICLSREIIRSGDLWRYFDLVKSLNVGYIQLLEPRPCGGYFADSDNVLLTEDDRAAVRRFFIEGNTRRRYRNYPIIHYVAYAEDPARLGCMMGGLTHIYIDSRGNVNPCVFVPVTFGNILHEDYTAIYHRMRAAVPKPVHKACPSLLLSDSIRRATDEGAALPVQYLQIKEDWDVVVER